MKDIYLESRKTNFQVTDAADISHVSNIIDEPCRVFVDGELSIVFGKLEKNYDQIKSILRSIKYNRSTRIAYLNKHEDPTTGKYPKNNRGFILSDRTFGYNPRSMFKSLPASPCAFNKQYPAWYRKLVELGKDITEEYKKYSAEKHDGQKIKVEESILPEYTIKDTVFTQGIINSNFSLPYHRDAKNFEGFWSCMAYFSNDVEGGDLILPTLDAAIRCKDGYFILFDGQSLFHGVSPIKEKTTQSFRYSIVYYANSMLKSALPAKEEMKFMNDSQTRNKL